MQIKNAWLFSGKRFVQTVLLVLITAVLAALFILFIVKVLCAGDADITYVHGMSLFSYFILWLTILFMGMMDFGNTFDMMVGMGRTRKEFFLSYTIVNFGTYLVYAGLVLLITWLETVIEKIFYAGIPCELNLTSFFFDARTIAFTILGGFAVNMIMGALYVKFRQKFYLFFAVLFMFSGVILQLLGKAMHPGNTLLISVFEFVLKIITSPAFVLILLFAGITIGVVTVSYLLVKRREISVW